MTDNNHPITPPPELLRRLREEAPRGPHQGVITLEKWLARVVTREEWITTQAARWGFNQRGAVNEAELQKARDEELEACRAWVEDNFGPEFAEHLRLFRRPKPLSLKELNLKHLDAMERDGHYLPEIIADLRRAIKSLPS